MNDAATTVRLELRFFARIREELGVDAEAVEVPGAVATVADLIGHLAGRGDTWRAVLGQANLVVAVNQEVVKGDAPVRDGDEVAFFPPVTGG